MAILNLSVYFNPYGADKAGIKKGDRLVELNDQSIEGLDFSEVKDLVKQRKVHFTPFFDRNGRFSDS